QVSVVGGRDIQVEVAGLSKGTAIPRNGKWCAKTNSGQELANPATGNMCDFATRAQALDQIQSVGQQQLLQLIGETARLEQREVIGSAQPTDKVTACPPDLARDPKCNDPKYVVCPVGQVDLPGCTNAELEKKDV